MCRYIECSVVILNIVYIKIYFVVEQMLVNISYYVIVNRIFKFFFFIQGVSSLNIICGGYFYLYSVVLMKNVVKDVIIILDIGNGLYNEMVVY